MEVKKGTFYGVGVGPGDPELMTLQAVRILEQCPVIAVPRTTGGKTLALDIARGSADLTGKSILPLDFSMEREKKVREEAHREAVRQIAEHLDRGYDVAMVNLGDVSIYSTVSYIIELLDGMGYATRMIPGITSFSAVAARLNVSLTEMDSPLCIIPAEAMDTREALNLPGNKILMKSGRQVAQVAEELTRAGKTKQAALVANCGLPDEAVCRDLNHLPENLSYFTTIIVKE